MIHKIAPILFVLSIYCTLFARPLNIIIVTSTDRSEDGYAEFLRDIYLDNANIEIDDDRYKESSLTSDEKQQLRDADLIIISSKNSGGDYNADSAFWASLGVPILSHNISICRSNNHDNWDWFSSGQTTVSVSEFYALDPNDAIFDGIDLTAGSISLFASPFDFSEPNEPYAGYGTPLATDQSGLPVIVRFDGSEPNPTTMTVRCMTRTACPEFILHCRTSRRPFLPMPQRQLNSCCEMLSPTYSPNAG
jgi:hypothetical protein